MNNPYTQMPDFDEVEKALRDNDHPFPAQMVYAFSDISAKNLSCLSEVWPEVWTERRRGLLEDMETLSEADTLLFFDNVALMCLQDEDPVARATAIRLLWQTEDPAIAPRLINLLENDSESIVRAAAATALGVFVYMGELEEIDQDTYQQVLNVLLRSHLSSDDVLVRRRALESLGYASLSEVTDYIQQAYDTSDEEWLQSALFAMGRSYDDRWHNHVLRMMDHPDSLVRYEAVRAAGELEIKAARELLFDLLEEGTDDEDLYQAAIWSLTKIGGSSVRSLIEASLEDAEDDREAQFLEDALENLSFTEMSGNFDLMAVGESDEEDDDWIDEDEDGGWDDDQD